MIAIKIKRKALVIGVAVLGLTLLACLASRTSAAATGAPVVNIAQNKNLDFTIVNKSGEAIHQVYIGPKDLQDWTDDMEVLKGQMLGNGASVGITFSPRETAKVWDIRVVYDMDNRGVYVRGVDLSRVKTLTIVQDNKGKTTFVYNTTAPVLNVVESKPLTDAQIPRDITDKGYGEYPRFLADVNNDGINDYCRAVGDAPNIFLSCQLGGRNGFSSNPYGFNSEAGKTDLGYPGTGWMEDVNADGRMDYCRQVGTAPNRFYAALLAGPNGFSKQQYTRIKRVEGDAGWVMQ